MELAVDFQRTIQDGNIQCTLARFFLLTTTSDVENLNINNVLNQLLEKVDAFSGQNSGWIVTKVKYRRLCWGVYRPLKVGTYIPTPKHIARKRAVVNINSTDNYFFQYFVLAGMNLISVNLHQHKNRPHVYKPFMRMLNMEGIQSPVPLSSIGKFESQNPNISVNVLYHDGEQIVPIHTPTFTDQRNHHVTLLMITDGNEKFHYLSVQSMSRLISTGAKYKTKYYVCHYCLYPFQKEDQLEERKIMCKQHQSQLIRYPIPGKDDFFEVYENPLSVSSSIRYLC